MRPPGPDARPRPLRDRRQRPLLLVFAAHGQGGEQLEPTFPDAAREPKEIWEVPKGSHTGGIEAEPEEYERRVVGFYDRALLGER